MRPGGMIAFGQRSYFEQRFQHIHPHYTVFVKVCIDRGIVARDCAGMGL